jgi:TusA-related sulfurtransferase
MKKSFTMIIIAFLLSGMIQAQEKTTLSVKDLNSDIEKYVKKNYKDYKIVEAFNYSLVYVMTIKKADATEKLIFDRDGKFLNKATEADKAKVALQTRSTLSLKEVKSDITKYIKKNFEGYNLTEAFMYDEVYTTKITKGAESETLLFDKEGKFVMKVVPPKPVEQPKKADSVAAKPAEQPKKADTAAATQVKKEEPKKADTTKK